MKADKLLKQAQRMQAQMMLAQEELGKAVVEGTSGGGAVKITANGHGDIISVAISREVVAPEDTEMLEDLVLAAARDALAKARELSNSKMNALTGGLGAGFPGLV